MTTENKVLGTVSWYDDRFYKITFLDGVKFFASITTVLGVTPKPHLAKWRGSVGNVEADRISTLGKERGTRLHNAFRDLMDGGKVIYNPQYQPVFTNEELALQREKYGDRLHIISEQDEIMHVYRFCRWIDTVKPIQICNDITLWDEMNEVAGSLDSLMFIHENSFMIAGSKPLTIPTGYYLVDYKTGASLDINHEIQVAKYREMLNNHFKSGTFNLTNPQTGEAVQNVAGGLLIHTNAQTRSGIEGLTTILIDGKKCDDLANHFNNHLLPMWKIHVSNVKPKFIELPTEYVISGSL